MLLRRITKHVTEQNWFAVLLDFLIVVFGLFIGLQVNNWNENRINARIADSYIERLKVDLDTEIKYFNHVIDYYRIPRDHALAALAVYNKTAKDLNVGFLVDMYQASQSINIVNRHGTYDELISTGRITLITSEDTRTMLNNYYESSRMRERTLEINTFVPYRKLVRMHMDESIQMEIRQHCNDIYTITDKNYYYVQLPTNCDISVPDNLVKQDIEMLLGNEEIRQELRFQLTSLDALLGALDNAIDTTEITLAKLKASKP